MNDMTAAVWITVLGMSLVFGAILLLWAMMILLTNLTPETENAAEDSESASEDLAQAAAAAVAVALAEQSLSAAHPLKLPETAIVSAWQLGMRMRQSAPPRRGRTR